MIRVEGNVIHADFRPRESMTVDLSVSCEMLYADEHVALARLTYRMGGKSWIQHVCKGAGIDV
jgi:hypothetical protein